MTGFDYLTDPERIERLSFQRLRRQTDLRGLDPQQRQVAMRLVHTCGDPGIVTYLQLSADAVAAGTACVGRGATVLCDVEMVRAGLSRQFVPGQHLCYLRDERAHQQAKARGQTLSMAAVERWRPHLVGAMAVIGNAPTALFRLLELIHDELLRPALVVGMPVGFVGAAEAKQALIELAPSMGIPYLTLTGTRGGSALAACTVNALGRLAAGIRL